LTDCVRCHKPVADTGYACHACAFRLKIALIRSAWLLSAQHRKGGAGLLYASDLETTVARLDVLGDGGPSSAETPLPFAWDASDAAWAIHNTLATWARHVSESRGHPLLAGRTSGVAVWLWRHVDWLRMRPEAEEAFDELHACTRLLQRTVDAHLEKWYAGRCGADTLDDEGLLTECSKDLYAPSGAEWVTCTDCGASFSAEDRKADLLDQVQDHLAIAEEIARALHAWGWPVTSAQIRGYAFRNRLLPHSRDGRERPLYRIGDVVDLLIYSARRGEKIPA
jgi:hypothetical protein